MAARQRTHEYWAEYTRDLKTADFRQMFTRDTPEAYRYFLRGLDVDKLVTGPWYRRWWLHTKIAFHAFTRRLTPARRLLCIRRRRHVARHDRSLPHGRVDAGRVGPYLGTRAALGPGTF
jgi:hypothetical protein